MANPVLTYVIGVSITPQDAPNLNNIAMAAARTFHIIAMLR